MCHLSGGAWVDTGGTGQAAPHSWVWTLFPLSWQKMSQRVVTGTSSQTSREIQAVWHADTPGGVPVPGFP